MSGINVPMRVDVVRLHPDACLPEYATDGSGCFDLRAVTADGYELRHSKVYMREPIIFGTGLSFEIPAGHAMLIFSRSGHGFKNDTRMANCVGVIDSDYRGEVLVKLTPDRRAGWIANDVVVSAGDRIAQAMIIPVPRVEFFEVDALVTTSRGADGFGSTGSA